MSSPNEIEIDYFNKRTKLSLPKNYSDFLELCKETFFISEERSKLMSFMYNDEDGGENFLDKEEYESPESRKAKVWKLIIEEEDDSLSVDMDKQLKDAKKYFLDEAEKFKNAKFKECTEKIQNEIKKRNEEHKKHIEIIKEKFKENLKKIKSDLKIQIQKRLETISDHILTIYKESMEEMDKGVKDNLDEYFREIQKFIEAKMSEVKIEEIENELKTMMINSVQYLNSFNRNIICQIEEKDIKTKEKTTNFDKNISFELKIKKIKEKPLSNCILQIKNLQDEKVYSINLDLSDIIFNNTKSKEIVFENPVRKVGNYKFLLNIKENNDFVSDFALLSVDIIDGSSPLAMMNNKK